MRVIIAGGRDLTSPIIEEIVRANLQALVEQVAAKNPGNPLAVRCGGGGAKGVDAVGKKVCDAFGLDYTVFEADWAKHGKKAGPIRNEIQGAWCAEDPECHLILVWDNSSKGSKHMHQVAQAYGITIHETIVSK